MPIIKFNGITDNQINEYANKINEIADLVVANPEAILLINLNTEVKVVENSNKRIYVEVEWLKRPEEARIALVNHLINFFKKEDINVSVSFKEINSNLYVNGVRRD